MVDRLVVVVPIVAEVEIVLVTVVSIEVEAAAELEASEVDTATTVLLSALEDGDAEIGTGKLALVVVALVPMTGATELDNVDGELDEEVVALVEEDEDEERAEVLEDDAGAALEVCTVAVELANGALVGTGSTDPKAMQSVTWSPPSWEGKPPALSR